jgi:hypothetical protein
MKKIVLIIGFFILTTSNLNAQIFQWIKPYFGTQANGRTVVNDENGGIYFGGQAKPSSNFFDSIPCYYFGNDDAIFPKTDTLGNIQWMHNIGNYGGDQITKLKHQNDKIYVKGYKQAGSFIIVDTLTIPASGSGYFISRFDTSGFMDWLTFRQNMSDFDVDASGTIYYAGTGGSVGHQIFKMNAAGTVIDSLALFTSSSTYGKQIMYDEQGSLIYVTPFVDSITFLGTTYSIPPNEPYNSTDFIIMKCDTDLSVQSVKHLSGRGQNIFYDMIIDNQGMLRTLSKWNDTISYDGITIPGSGQRMVFSIHSSNLDLLNHYDLNITHKGSAEITINDFDEYYLGMNYNDSIIINGDTLTEGTSSPFGVGCIAKLTGNGQIVWYRNIAQDPSASFTTGSASVFLSKPQGDRIYVAGSMRGPGPTIIDTTLYNTTWPVDIIYTGLLIDTTYGLSTGIQLIIQNTNPQFILSPNPTNGTTTIVLNELYGYAMFKVVDILGNTIYETEVSNSLKHEIDLENISSGIYFVILLNDKISGTKKLIVNRDF